jgi:membrane-associated phospholipid phosphatase
MRLARIATEAFAPWIWLIAMPYAIAWLATHDLAATLGWGTLLTITGSVIPMAVIWLGTRRGRYDSHHVHNRERRLVPILVALACQSLGLIILILAETPPVLPSLTAGLVAVGFVSLAVTVGLRWKLSLHAAASAGSVTLLIIGYGWWPTLLVPLVLLVSWSRLKLGHHTLPQVLAALALGPLAALTGHTITATLLS